MAAWPWQSGGGSSAPAQSSNYWGNQSYAAGQQQAQYAGMPTQQNYQSPTGTQVAAPSQQSPWGTPQQGAWQSAPASGGSTAPQSSSGGAGAQWGSGGGGWGQPAPPPMANPQQNAQQYGGSYSNPVTGGSYVPDGHGGLVYMPPQQGNTGTFAQPGQLPPPNWWQQGQPGPQQQQGPDSQSGGIGAPPPNGDTNGFQMPRMVQPPASRYAMPGWDSNKWNDPNHISPKYVVGRILSNLPGRTDSMDTAVSRIAAAYPGSKRVGDGDISIPGVGVIDILMGSAAGGRGWWWGDAAQIAAGQKKAAPAPGSNTLPTPTQAWPGGPDINTMMAQLMAAQPQQRVQQAAPVQQQAAPQVDVSQYTRQIQQLQTQLAELQAGQNQRRGLNVTYF